MLEVQASCERPLEKGKGGSESMTTLPSPTDISDAEGLSSALFFLRWLAPIFPVRMLLSPLEVIHNLGIGREGFGIDCP
jgi:hypothetical protein